MATLRTLVVKIVADANDMVKGVNDAQTSVGGFAAKLKGWAPAIGAAAGVAFLAVGKAALDAAFEVDDALDKIRVATGETGPALAQLEKDFRAVWTGGPEGAQQVADAISTINTKLEVTGPALQTLTRALLDLARVTGSDLNTVVESSTQLFANWGIQVEQAVPSLDKILRASQASGVQVVKLTQSLADAGPTLRQLGIDFDTGAALIASFEKAGISSDIMVAGLRKSVVAFAKDNVPAQDALKETISQIKTLGPGADATKLAMETFGAKAGPQLAVAITEGRLATEAILGAIKGGKETVQSASDDTKGFSEQWAQAKNALNNALEPLGTTLLKALETLMPSIIQVANATGFLITKFVALIDGADKLSQSVGETIRKMVDFVFNQLVTRFTAIVDGVRAKLEAITGFFKTMADKVALHSYIPDMMDVVDVQLGTRFAKIAMEAATHTEEITDHFADMNFDVQEGAIMTSDAVQDAFGPKLAGLAEAFGINIKDLPTSFEGVTGLIIGSAGNLIDRLGDFFGTKFSDIVTGFINTWKKIENIVKKFVDAIDKILNFNPGAFTLPGGLPGTGIPGGGRRQVSGFTGTDITAPGGLTDVNPPGMPGVQVTLNFNAPIQTADPEGFVAMLSDAMIDAIDRGLGKLAQRRAWQQGGSSTIA